jgi:hypothetical protein
MRSGRRGIYLVLQILKRSRQSSAEAGEGKEKREKLPWTESARSDLCRTIHDPTGGNNSGDVDRLTAVERVHLCRC